MEKMIARVGIICLISSLMMISTVSFAENIPDQYVRDIERISTRYNADMKFFLRSLDPKISQFNQAQQAQFCAILKQYVDDMYKTTDQHRKYLPLSSQSVTKQTIIDKVMVSPEMKKKKKYNIQCNLN